MKVFPPFLDKHNDILSTNRIDTFEALWDLKVDWFEPPNYRRNGWSGVSRMELNKKNGQTSAIFIKRQENHNYRTFMHPLNGVPTFRREFMSFRSLNEIGVPTLEPLYYAENPSSNGIQAILVTKALEDFVSAEDYFSQPHDLDEIQQVLKEMAILTRKLHNARLRHGCLYPKHFFISAQKNKVDVRLIDLEKLKWFPFQPAIMLNDIGRFIRRRGDIKAAEIQFFLDCYLSGPGPNLTQSLLKQKLEKILLENS